MATGIASESWWRQTGILQDLKKTITLQKYEFLWDMIFFQN